MTAFTPNGLSFPIDPSFGFTITGLSFLGFVPPVPPPPVPRPVVPPQIGLRLIPNDTLDFAYAISPVRVQVPGVMRVLYADGIEAVLKVQRGQFVAGPIKRIFLNGTTAGGFTTGLSERALGVVPYASADQSAAQAATAFGLTSFEFPVLDTTLPGFTLYGFVFDP